jgi:SAM-dependent methyltransferase
MMKNLLLLLLLVLLSCTNQQTTSNDWTNIPFEDSVPLRTNSVGISEDYLHTNRGIWQKPDVVVSMLGDLENKVVADIGAGTGFFTYKILPRAEKVIAIDIDPSFIHYLDSLKAINLPESQYWRLETRLAVPNRPAPINYQEVDVILVVNTYTYLEDRINYLQSLRENLKPGGKLVIIDFKKKRTPVGPPQDIRLPLYVVEEELYEAGFEYVHTNDTYLDFQYILTAEKELSVN